MRPVSLDGNVDGLLADPLSPNEEPVGGGANEVERIAGHQRKDFIAALIQWPNIVRTHNPGGYDAIPVLAKPCAYCYDVVLPDIAQRSKKYRGARKFPRSPVRPA